VTLTGRGAGGIAVEPGGIVVAVAIHDLSCQPGEQCLCAFCAVNHVELAFGLSADDALFEVVVLLEKQTKA
jgi:hypothetical protein